MRELSFFDPSLRRRLRLGAILALCGVAPALPDIVRALLGGRFQGEPGAPVDLWARAAVMFAACAVGGVAAAALGPLWRHRWGAGVLATVCIWPIAVVSSTERGPQLLPARVSAWVMSAGFALAVGGYVVARYPTLAAQLRERYAWARAQGVARRRKRAAG